MGPTNNSLESSPSLQKFNKKIVFEGDMQLTLRVCFEHLEIPLGQAFAVSILKKLPRAQRSIETKYINYFDLGYTSSNLFELIFIPANSLSSF